jgi:superfamily II DNA/RNA helicase
MITFVDHYLNEHKIKCLSLHGSLAPAVRSKTMKSLTDYALRVSQSPQLNNENNSSNDDSVQNNENDDSIVLDVLNEDKTFPRVLVCTDVASRGIDLPLVCSYDKTNIVFRHTVFTHFCNSLKLQ